MSQELKILQNLIHNEIYTRKVLPFLKEEYFEDESQKILYKLTNDFVNKYNNIPTPEALVLTVNEQKNIPEKVFEQIGDTISSIKEKPNDDINWLVDITEKFCKKRAQFIALTKSIAIYDGTDKTTNEDAIPGILQKALAVSFDPKVGHDYFENFVERYEYYTRKEIKVPFDIDVLNEITKGGLSQKTLTILIAGPNVGKTAAMCHMAAANVMDGKNVLYCTAEMSEEEISRRIDANLLDTTTDNLEHLPLQYFSDAISKLKGRTQGRLVVKEFETGGANVGDITRTIGELNLKKNFIPDIIYIDYMNLFNSIRHKGASADKSYGIVKSVSEEFRSIAIGLKVPVVTATQFNRQGAGDSDPDENSISDSFGPIMTADLVLGLIRNEALAKADQIMFKQLKSRYMDKHRKPKFLVGFNPAKGKMTNIASPTKDITVVEDYDQTPVFDKSENGIEIKRLNPNKKLSWNGG